MWTGWGLRTLAEHMGAYDPLSYHNGSVWPHDTALCAAGAAALRAVGCRRPDRGRRLGRGACEFDGRPPELFAGISRSEAPMPVIYPSSCSPQAWSSASVLLLVRTMLGLTPMGTAGPVIGRTELSTVPDLALHRLRWGGEPVAVELSGGLARVVREG